MKITCISLPTNQYNNLKKKHDKDGTPISFLVRKALEQAGWGEAEEKK